MLDYNYILFSEFKVNDFLTVLTPTSFCTTPISLVIISLVFAIRNKNHWKLT